MNTPATSQRMSKVDTAWLRMDTPHNLMMILGVWVLRPRLAYADLLARVGERLLAYPRFRQTVRHDALGAVWVDDPAFDLRRHVLRERLPRRRGPGAQLALQQRLGQLAASPLPADQPLWCFHFIEDFDGGSALLARIHHCIADGLALIAVMQSLVDGGACPPAPPTRGARAPLDRAQAWMTHSLIEPLTLASVKALERSGEQAALALEALVDPLHAWHSWQQGDSRARHAGASPTADLAWQVLRDAAALVLMGDDSPTALKGQPRGVKRVAWCQPLPLDEVRAVARALHASINDVLLACVAGALAGHLNALGQPTHGVEIRAMVPVNLRPQTQAHELGNHFGLAPVVLPLGLRNPVQRVADIHRRMAGLKNSLQPLLAFGLLAAAGLLPKGVQDLLLGLFSRKTTAVMTNVPGPRDKLKLCGVDLEQTLFWVPQTGSVGLGVSILSYAGGVQFGLIADTAICPDPQDVIARFAPEFDSLRWLALMLPWGPEELSVL